MSKRQTLPLDYKIFHTEGRKVVKVTDTTSTMEENLETPAEFNRLKSVAIDCYSDVEDFFDTYSIDEIENDSDIQDYVSKLGDLKREFRRTHAHIRSIMETDEFDNNYPDYAKELDNLTKHFKIATKKLADVKASSVKPLDPEELRVISNYECCLEKISWDIDDLVWEDIDELDEVKTIISKLEKHLDDFQKVRSDSRVFFSNRMPEGMSNDLDSTFKSLTSKISSGRAWYVRLKAYLAAEAEKTNLASEAARVEKEKLEEEEKVKNLMTCAENLPVTIF